MPPTASALKSLTFPPPEQGSIRLVPQEELEVPPVLVGDADVSGCSARRSSCQRADQLPRTRLQPGETPPILPLQQASITRALPVALPVATSSEQPKRRAVLPDEFVAFPLRIGLRGGVGERQLLVLLDVGRPCRAGQVGRPGERPKLRSSLDEVQLRVELRGSDGAIGDNPDVETGVLQLLDGQWIGDTETQADDCPTAGRWTKLEELGRARGLGVRSRDVDPKRTIEGSPHPILQCHLLVQPRLVPHRHSPTGRDEVMPGGHSAGD
jgi:hypothetical protein